jgi:acyl-CoA thioester hydrolase
VRQRIGLIDLFRSEKIGPILAPVSCDYNRQITFPDTIRAAIRVARVGRTSMCLEHAFVGQSQHAVAAAEGNSTIVVCDFRDNRPHPVPASLRHAIEELHGRSPEGVGAS